MRSFLRQFWDERQVHVLVALAGVNLLAIFVYLGQRQDLLHPVAIYLGLYAIAFGFYLYAGRVARRAPRPSDRSLIWIIVLFALAMRLALLHSTANLSTDIYRYVWDGRLTCHWVNPYRWSPLDSRLAQYRNVAIWQPMEYKAYQTVYMPVSQLFFAIAYAIFRTNLLGFKLIFTLCDVIISVLVMAILKQMGKDPVRVIWYAWCPLPIVEVSLAGHQDVTGIVMLMLAMYLLVLGRQRATAIALAAAGLTKGFALLLFPVLWRKCDRRLALATTLSLVYLGLPLWVYLPKFLHGMQQYLNYVHVNSGLFSLVDVGLSFVTPLHFKITSVLSDAAILVAVAWSCWTRAANSEEIFRRSIVVIAVCLLTVPSLFPWYVLWLLPLVAIYGSSPSAAFVCLAGTVDLVYIYYFDQAVHWWVPVIEYLPVYALIACEIRRGYWRPPSLDEAGGGSSAEPLAIDSDGAGAASGSVDRVAGVEATW